jgi:hypothetical protein
MPFLRDHRRFVFVVAALLAIALRAALPPGFMFAPDAQDGRYLTVTLCALHGSTEQVLDLETGALLPEKPNAPTGTGDLGKAPCVFAAVAALAAPMSAGMMLVQPPPIIASPVRIAIAATPGRGLAAPPPFATGPPLSFRA